MYDDKHVLKITRGSSCLKSDETLLWHHCFGHVNEKRMKKLQQINLLDSFGDTAIWHANLVTKSPFKR